MLRHLITRFLGDASGEMLRTTAKTAAIVGAFSIGSAWYLSDRIDAEKRALDQIIAGASQPGGRAARGPGVDLTTTGAISRAPRIDPCAVEPAKR